jgi:uncharacterized protein YjbI with pentapeptide repeats
VRLSNDNFDYADLRRSIWQGGQIHEGNSFVGADFRGFRWFDLDFEQSQETDFSDADLSEVMVSDQGFLGSELTEKDIRLRNAKLCRTKFSAGISMRSCS